MSYTPSSLTLLQSLTARGLSLRADGGFLEVQGPVEQLTEDLRAELSACKADLMALLAPPPDAADLRTLCLRQARLNGFPRAQLSRPAESVSHGRARVGTIHRQRLACRCRRPRRWCWATCPPLPVGRTRRTYTTLNRSKSCK